MKKIVIVIDFYILIARDNAVEYRHSFKTAILVKIHYHSILTRFFL